MKLVFNPHLNYRLKYSFCDIQCREKSVFIIHVTDNYYEKITGIRVLYTLYVYLTKRTN
jgi:hypothetical protein